MQFFCKIVLEIFVKFENLFITLLDKKRLGKSRTRKTENHGGEIEFDGYAEEIFRL